ncbi:MAG: N-acetyl-gamma-glutamyl-phosphate reductase, partial [Acidimicrobiaceae bacterium]
MERQPPNPVDDAVDPQRAFLCTDLYDLSVARIGIFGASGYTGAELLRLAAGHPDFNVVLATADSQVGTKAADLSPSLAAAYPDLVFTDPDPAAAEGLDLIFLGLPHGASQDLVPDLRKRVPKIVDLAADFRLR